jgi:hypothetical protein
MEMQGGAYGIYEGEIEPLLRRVRHHDDLAVIEATPCPCCGAALRVLVWPDGRYFQLLCAGVPPHMSTLQDLDPPPPWWAERVIEPVESIVS